MTAAPDDPLRDYRTLLARLDAHAARVEEAWADRIACEVGCSGCCHRDLSVFPVEAAAIAHFIAERRLTLEATERPPMSPTALDVLELDGAEPCAMLDGAGRCRIYEARPVICRTHGLPLAIADDDGVYGDVCPLSFEGGAGLAEVPGDDFLALSTVNTVLVALNGAFVAATGAAEERVALRDLAGRSPD